MTIVGFVYWESTYGTQGMKLRKQNSIWSGGNEKE